MTDHDRPITPGDDPTESTVTEADAAILDALLEAQARGMAQPLLPPDAEPQRVQRAQKLLGLLALDAPADDATDAQLDALTDRTLEAVAAQRQRDRFASQVQVLAEPRRTIGVSWRQVMTAAAVFLIAMSLLLPVMNKTRHDAMRSACASNLGLVGAGFGLYANDHAGSLPSYAVNPSDPWWRVGQTVDENKPVQSNSANLYLLVRRGYAAPDALNCAANADAPAPGTMTAQHTDYPSHDAISYSYQNQFRATPVRIDLGEAVALLADRNPLFLIRRDGFSQRYDVAFTSPSVVHGSRGQNVLLGDGQVVWTKAPLIAADADDNLWTVTGVERYHGDETPQRPDENFLVP